MGIYKTALPPELFLFDEYNDKKTSLEALSKMSDRDLNVGFLEK